MGIGNVPSVPSLALGSGEVTLMAMTSAYGAFADDGRLHAATFIRRVEDAEGKVLFVSKPAPEQVLSPRTAFLMTSMLSDVVNFGTAYKARQEGFTYPAAGKTGTTNDYVDAWFVGFTPHLVTGVWVGFDKPRTIIANGFAGELAVPMWARFMKAGDGERQAGHVQDGGRVDCRRCAVCPANFPARGAIALSPSTSLEERRRLRCATSTASRPRASSPPCFRANGNRQASSVADAPSSACAVEDPPTPPSSLASREPSEIVTAAERRRAKKEARDSGDDSSAAETRTKTRKTTTNRTEQGR